MIAALLVFANILIYGQILGFDFVNFDDEIYVTKNAVVQTGLSPSSLAWAFTTFTGSHWHPLTWVSHLLDCELFGLAAGRHHLTSVLIHTASTVLLFFLLVEVTGMVWPNALVAALFSLHPLRVESVAWIAERKDVLSGLFFVLTLWAWAFYVRAPSWRRYLTVLSAFTLGLLAKSMLVTLPFVLLLLDYWPFDRFARWPKTPSDRRLAPNSGRPGEEHVSSPPTVAMGMPPLARPVLAKVPLARLLLEKLPLLALSTASLVMNVLAQRSTGALSSFHALPPGERLANAICAWGRYLVMTVWPHGLAVYYPFEAPLPGWKVAGSVAILVAVTVVSLSLTRTRPALLVGWLWYVGVLVPVIGLVQVGAQAYADRYTYLPSIGLLVALVHGVLVPALEARPVLRVPLAWTGAIAVVLLTGLSWGQVRHWRNSVTLFEHALSVTNENGVAHYDLGCALANEGHMEEALAHYREAVRIRPDFPPARHNLGITLLGKGQVDAAIAELRDAARLDPEFGDAQLNLGVALAMKGKVAEALGPLGEAVRLMPGDPIAHYNLGVAQQELGQVDAAIASYARTLEIDPGHAGSRFGLAKAFAANGRTDEAVAQLSRLLKAQPAYPGAAMLMATLKRTPPSRQPAVTR